MLQLYLFSHESTISLFFVRTAVWIRFLAAKYEGYLIGLVTPLNVDCEMELTNLVHQRTLLPSTEPQEYDVNIYSAFVE